MLIIFDLDGVLLESKDLHFVSLNNALATIDKKFCISQQEHLVDFDGLPTYEKLKKLSVTKNFPADLHSTTYKLKQTEFLKLLESIEPQQKLTEIFYNLKKLGYKIAVASNSIRDTVRISLCKLHLIEYVDYFVSNEDVKRSKPHPEMFWKCMTEFNETPATTLIVEDSIIGRQAALSSGANYFFVNNTSEITWENLSTHLNKLSEIKNIPWKNSKMNVLIPMAGAGSRFSEAGYSFPKPLIDVNGKPMIELVVNNLNIDANYIFLVRKEHYDQYNLKYMLNLISPGCSIVIVDNLTEGAACTSLLAKELINDDNPLLIANSDQFVEWNSADMMYSMANSAIDGGILVFESHHPKWSYALTDNDDNVIEVAEKKVISNLATVGIYYWKHGKDYVKYAEQMIDKNIRTNNEFYICPVYNEAIADGKKIKISKIKKMWGLGTPEDLINFQKYTGTLND